MRWRKAHGAVPGFAVLLFLSAAIPNGNGKDTSARNPTARTAVGRTVDGRNGIQPGAMELVPGFVAPGGLSGATSRTGMAGGIDEVLDRSTFRVSEPTYGAPDGSRAFPLVVDGIDLGGVSMYCWGLAYDWDNDALWVTQFNDSTMYLIEKTSPLTILGSVTVHGMPLGSYFLGIAYAGASTMYMVDYWGSLYQIDLTTGNATYYRALPFDGEGLGWSVADDAAYPGDWFVDQCAYAIPSLTGAWTTWARTDVSGLAASYDGTTSPSWLWVVDELSPQAYLYQYSLTAGVPSALPAVTWELPAGMTMLSTADCAYDGQYVYVLDQSLNTDSIWVLEPVLLNTDAEVVSIDYPNIDCFVMTPAVAVTVQATIRNNGTGTETFDVTCVIDSAGTLIYTDTESVTLNSTQSTQVNFAPQWDAPVEDANYYVSVKTELAGDENPANDSLATRAKAVTWTDEIAYDDGVMTNAWRFLEPYSYDSIIAKKFEPPYYPCFVKYAAVYLLSDTDPYWPWPDATHDPVELTVWTDTDGDDVPDNLVFRDSVTGDATAPSWVYVVPFDTLLLGNFNFWVGLNGLPGGGEEGIGLDAATNFAGNKYTGSYGGVWHTQNMYAGDEMVRAYVSMLTLDHNVGVSSIDNPSSYQIPPLYNITPQATVTNYGLYTESFDVVCEIDQGGVPVYTNTQTVSNLAPGNSTPVSFANWLSGAEGNTYTLTFYTDLAGDEYTGNDTLSTSVYCSYWIFYDDGTSEGNYTVGTYANDKFAVRFSPLFEPFDCESIAVYLSLVTNMTGVGFGYWDYLQVCPDMGGIPDTANPDTVLYNVGTSTPPEWLYLRPNVTNVSSTNDLWILVHWMDAPDNRYVPCMGSDAADPDGRSWWYSAGSGWNQWTTHDWMVGVKLIPPAVTDAQVVIVDNPYAPGFIAASTFSPAVTVKNNGSGNENFDVTFEIDSAGVNVYSSTVAANGMSAGEQRQLTFAPFAAPPLFEGAGYSMTVFTQLAGDERSFNDTISKTLDANQRVMAIIQDSDAWTYASNQEVLNLNVIPFGIYTRWAIGNVDLSQFSKVVVTNDQTNIFYSIVQANNAWFENYVNGGGYFELHSADGSWRAGYWNTANPLPGGYYWNQTYVDSVYIKLPRHIILNVPNMIMNPELGSWNYVTHGYFTTIPANTDTALIADDGITTYGPSLTITEVPLGADTGLYIYSGLTEEWSWFYTYSFILENTLLYPPTQPLSVELSYFAGNFEDGAVVLRWETASEEDNAFWRIDRRHEDGDWQTVATVASEGNAPNGRSYEYRDEDVLVNNTYTYRLGDVNTGGHLTWRSEVVVHTFDSGAPKVFALGQNYPNPFVHQTFLKYQVPRKERVTIVVYDAAGREVRTLTDAIHDPGFYQTTWDGCGEQGREAGSGVYFCRMNAGGFTKTRRLIHF